MRQLSDDPLDRGR